MKDTMNARREGLIVHKHGLNTLAPYMAMRFVTAERLRQMGAPRGERKLLRARLRAILKRAA